MSRADVKRAALGSLAFAALTALAARVELPLPLSPVPVSLQSLAVVLSGLLLGARIGALSQALYLLVGALGLPVFAGGAAGLDVLLGATGGYLVAFVPAAALAGWAGRREAGTARRLGWSFLTGLLAHAAIFALGLPWLMVVAELGIAETLEAGCTPFLPGAVAKSFVAAAIATPRRVPPIS